MPGKTIAIIYFYLISAGAVILMVIGIFNVASFLVNSTQFDQYPLRYGAMSNCDNRLAPGPYGPTPAKIMPANSEATPTAEELQKAKKLCLQNDEADRKQHRVEDLKNAVTFSFVGLILFGIHFPIARKQSKNG